MKIPTDPVTLATPFFILSVILEIVLARSGKLKARYEARDTGVSLTMGLFSTLSSLPIAGLSAAGAVWCYHHRLFTIPMNAAWAWIAVFLLEDLTYYWFHRLSHERRVWWAAHVNHHSSQHYNLSTALRQTWTGGVAFTWALWLPLSLLGFPPAMVAIEKGVSLVYQYWIHTEAIGRMPRWFEAVFNTPSHHRVHHARNPRYLDRNYAGILIVWDRLFGTFQAELDDEAPRYGLVHNLGTFNILRVAFHEWIGIAQDIVRSPRHAVGWLFGPPGWSPDGSRDTSARLKAQWAARQAPAERETALAPQPAPPQDVSAQRDQGAAAAAPTKGRAMDKTPLSGSERTPLRGARAIRRAAGDQRLEVSVIVRRRDKEGLQEHLADVVRGARPRPLAHEEFAAAYGAEAGDLQSIADFAAAHGLSVVQRHPGRRTVVLSGTVAQFEAAFGVELHEFEFDEGTYRGRTGPLHLPTELDGVVDAVLGLDNRPAARPQFRIRPAAAAGVSFSPLDLARLYGFPAGDGAGQTIALIELGGGYKPADLKAYFQELGTAAPKVSAVSVDHGANAPSGDPNSADGEVMLDIEVAGAIAPGAAIAVYFAPNTDAGFLDAITTAVHDTARKPAIVSISWGGPESSWTAQALSAFDSAFQDAAALGITVLVAAGDNGSTDGVTDGAQHVDFPASSPHATACGGTRLTASGQTISAEQVWNDGASGGAGGGGVSASFPLPSWQQGLKATPTGGAASLLTHRGVPDVAGDADPQSGYRIRVDGQDAVFGGTSAVAPLWAGLIARINGAAGVSAGFLNPALYKAPQALRDITSGDNGAFAAAKGWDACAGLGSPNGQAVAGALTP